jgi:hypothetical protein
MTAVVPEPVVDPATLGTSRVPREARVAHHSVAARVHAAATGVAVFRVKRSSVSVAYEIDESAGGHGSDGGPDESAVHESSLHGHEINCTGSLLPASRISLVSG